MQQFLQFRLSSHKLPIVVGRFAEHANQKRREVTYKVGDEVLLSTKNIRLKNPGAKKLFA